MTTALDSYAEKARDIFERDVKNDSSVKEKDFALVLIFPKIGKYIVADSPQSAVEKRKIFMEQQEGKDVGPSFTFNFLGSSKTSQ